MIEVIYGQTNIEGKFHKEVYKDGKLIYRRVYLPTSGGKSKEYFIDGGCKDRTKYSFTYECPENPKSSEENELQD